VETIGKQSPYDIGRCPECEGHRKLFEEGIIPGPHQGELYYVPVERVGDVDLRQID
jgi:hypothetical protein